MSFWVVTARKADGTLVGYRRRARICTGTATVYSSPSAAASSVVSAKRHWPEYVIQVESYKSYREKFKGTGTQRQFVLKVPWNEGVTDAEIIECVKNALIGFKDVYQGKIYITSKNNELGETVKQLEEKNVNDNFFRRWLNPD